MFDSLRSNVFKIKKTPLFWLMFLWPVVVVGVFIAYYSVAAWHVEQELSGYFQVLSLGMPCIITLLCAFIAQQEQSAGESFNILCVGKSRVKTFFSLFVLIFILTAIGMMLAALGFYLFYGRMTSIYYILTSILMLIPLPCLLLIQIFLL